MEDNKALHIDGFSVKYLPFFGAYEALILDLSLTT